MTADVDSTAIVAIYAALVATAGLLWQIYAWWHRRRSHVTVEARAGMLVPQGLEIITISVRNRSEHTVRVTSIDLELQDGSGRHMPVIHQLPGATLPGEIQPHDAGQAFVSLEEAKGIGVDLTEPLTVVVGLATGGFVKSKPERLLSKG